MAFIKRAITDVLHNRVSNSKVLLLTGPRQVGKSTLLKHEYDNYHYVTFDNDLIRAQARDEQGLFFLNNPTPLIIDEVQKEVSILNGIKLRVDASNERGNFLLTGSQKLELMKGVSESLAGRISILELSCLSLREINNISFNKHFVPTLDYISEREKELKKYDNIWKTIHRGMYPELYDTNRDWLDFYASYVNTYLERDVNSNISLDSVTFLKFLTAVAARTGQILEYASIANEIEVTIPTVKNWISILERTGIIYLLQPYSSSHLTRTIKAPKIYFRDTGLACYLSRWLTADALAVSAVNGNMFETFVVSEILKSYANEGRDYRFNVFYYRGKDKNKTFENEIDLIIEENGTLYPIEIKLTSNPKASMSSANMVLDKVINKKRGMGAIICLIDAKLYLRENLIALPIEYL